MQRTLLLQTSANEYTFVRWDGELMPENFPAGQFSRKAFLTRYVHGTAIVQVPKKPEREDSFALKILGWT